MTKAIEINKGSDTIERIITVHTGQIAPHFFTELIESFVLSTDIVFRIKFNFDLYLKPS